ncbi:MAG: preprotein translocase subunit SecE [Burkholderiaceae bacterium]|jgi:preprotein translocase subunit SecE|nr:preprotein translocase subunit SecE [Burkholderiaceae bacterium]MDP3423231.1 preprotein translocase subunit SecE [Burkholderiaceae bacterium]MDZ4161696.1 preprotein translocase subunit SecE [Burkholderiales bacterium]
MASPDIETVSTGADKAKVGVSLALLLAAFFAYYLLSKQGPYVQWAGLLALVAASVAVYLLSDSGRRLVAFGRDSYRELSKVVWPERKEAIQMTMYVFGFVLVMAIFLWLTDKVIEWAFYDLILGWRK